MDTLVTYRGREVRSQDVAFLRDMIAASPKTSRRALSFKVCEAWAWAQPNGAPCDALCRGLMLKLHREGHLELPPPVWTSRQPRRHAVVTKIDIAPAPLAASLADIGPLDIRQVRRTPDEELVKSLVQEHHYLGYVHPVGEHLKYLISARGQPIACFCWVTHRRATCFPRRSEVATRVTGGRDGRHGENGRRSTALAAVDGGGGAGCSRGARRVG